MTTITQINVFILLRAAALIIIYVHHVIPDITFIQLIQPAKQIAVELAARYVQTAALSAIVAL